MDRLSATKAGGMTTQDDQARGDTTGSAEDSPTASANEVAPAFTAGPWRVASRENATTLSVWSAGHVVTGIAYVHASEINPEGEANAHLIAAAPDLYAALKQLRTEVNAILGISEAAMRLAAGNTNVAVLRLKAEEARAALAKAEGR
jgi:hypothetical protein